MSGPGHEHTEDQAVDFFEPAGWQERYAGDETLWSGRPNPQLVAEVRAGTGHCAGWPEPSHPAATSWSWVTRRPRRSQLSASHHRAMWLAEDLLPGLPEDFEVLVAEQRPRTMERDGETVHVHDSTLLARRTT